MTELFEIVFHFSNFFFLHSFKSDTLEPKRPASVLLADTSTQPQWSQQQRGQRRKWPSRGQHMAGNILGSIAARGLPQQASRAVEAASGAAGTGKGGGGDDALDVAAPDGMSAWPCSMLC